MKKLYLIRNKEVFQGEKYLRKDKNYFEGWYFKNICDNNGISFIPGISINKKEKKAFIQVITNDNSYFIDYDINDFEYSFSPFYIKIRDNYFSKDKVHIDIEDDKQDLIIFGDIRYYDNLNINTSILNPNIMGIFSYVPFMECNHAILSMKSEVNGLININGNEMVFNNGIGYIEKDWGYSFPKSYIWCQGNNFKNSNDSFMISIADIPFKIFSFRGIICSLIVDNREYRFATYNNAKLINYSIDNGLIDITLKKGRYYLNLKSKCESGLKLSAPVKGKMEKDILESIDASIIVTLKKNNRVIFSDSSNNCGLEIVDN